MRIVTFLRRRLLFSAGLGLYLLVALIRPEMMGEVLRHTWIYFRELFEIMPLIILLATTIDAWIPKAFVLGKLGKDAGWQGAFYAYVIGSISAGPIYAAFPIVRLLMEKGASVQSAVIIISSWAVIKVPMLINEVKFLGFPYMAIRWVLTIVAIGIMSALMARWVSRDQVVAASDRSDDPPIQVDVSACIGCGLCARLAPDVFEMVAGKGRLTAGGMLHPGVHTAAEQCPSQAIRLHSRKMA